MRCVPVWMETNRFRIPLQVTSQVRSVRAPAVHTLLYTRKEKNKKKFWASGLRRRPPRGAVTRNNAVGMTPIATAPNEVVAAAERGDEQVVREWLSNTGVADRGACVLKLLLAAAEEGQEPLADLLLQHCDDVNKPANDFGQTALRLAATHGDGRLVRRLLQHGAFPNHRDDDGDTALVAAAEEGHEEVVNALLRGRADPCVQCRGGEIALQRAVTHGHTAVVRALLCHDDAKAFVRSVPWDRSSGCTLLTSAATGGHERTVDELLDCGASIDGREENDQTALMVAAQHGHGRVVELLLRRGACVNLVDLDADLPEDQQAEYGNGYAALALAAYYGHPTIVSRLLQAGADMSLRGLDGKTALQLARDKGNVACVEAIRAHLRELSEARAAHDKALAEKAHAERQAREEAEQKEADRIRTWLRDEEAVLAWLDGGGEIDAPEITFDVGRVKDGTMLMLAADDGQGRVVDIMLQHGADANRVAKNGSGLTALMFAAEQGHAEVVELLLRRGADVNYQTRRYQRTALMMARRHLAVVDTLLAAGAQPDLQDCAGDTALMAVVKDCHPTDDPDSQRTDACSSIVLRLLRAGADPEIRSVDGETAIELAKKPMYEGYGDECVRVIEEHMEAEAAQRGAALLAEIAAEEAAVVSAQGEQAGEEGQQEEEGKEDAPSAPQSWEFVRSGCRQRGGRGRCR